MEYIPIQCKSAIRKVRGGMPYQHDVNIYRGCEHGCLYCYALYSHDYLDDEKFYDHIYYKENIVEILEKEISKPSWQKNIINFGSVSDSYQPCEKELGLMREVLKLMIRYQNPVNISTKSTLILRDIDLLAELSKVAAVNLTCTVTCADESIQQVIEPRAATSLERMKVLQILKQKTNASVGILMMPIIPYITDSYENIEAIYKLAQQIDLDYIVPGTLYLRGKTKPYFLNSIRQYDENLYWKLKHLYPKGSCLK
ncbi:MAG: radical SAM protein, partial [Coprobacillus cateniformis]